jgi:hypothetical protein
MKHVLLSSFIVMTFAAEAQTSSTNSPAAAANTMCAFSYSSTVGYTPAANVMASDNVYATAVHCNCCDQNTQCLQVTDFGFSIPAGAVIDGIVLEVEKKRSAASGPGSTGIVEDNGLQIMKSGVLVGPNKSQYGVDWPLTDTYVSYGTPTDLWGTTWTPAEINASDFGVSLASISYICGSTITTYIDHVKITVYYSTATGISEKAISAGQISVFPNPADEESTISFSNVSRIGLLTITDELGKEIFRGSSDKNEIALPGIKKGIYFYHIENSGTVSNGKLIIN